METLRTHTRRPKGDPDKDCRGEVVRSEAKRAASRRRIERRKLLVEETLLEAKSKPCADCGGSFPHPAMEFDHVRGEKLFNIANFKRQPTRALVTLLTEITKCDLVCSNCHAIRHWNRLHPDRAF